MDETSIEILIKLNTFRKVYTILETYRKITLLIWKSINREEFSFPLLSIPFE